jgi:hypothetical protein
MEVGDRFAGRVGGHLERRSLMKVNREELAWAAGFFDGEGNFRISRQNGLRMTATQTYRPHLERFKAAVSGLGFVYGPYRHGGSDGRKRQPIYHWHASSFEHAQAAAAMLFPFLGEPKRQQILTALRQHRKRAPFKWQLCERAGHRIGLDKQGHFCSDCRREWNRTHRRGKEAA